MNVFEKILMSTQKQWNSCPECEGTGCVDCGWTGSLKGYMETAIIEKSNSKPIHETA